MTEDRTKPRRSLARVLGFAALFAIFGCALLGAAAFQYGMSVGLAAGATTYVLYAIPATIYDWPRVTFGDVLAFLAGILAFIMSLFDW